MKTRGAKKPKKTFADIDAGRKRYSPEAEGYGDASEWRDAFRERMGFEEAERVIHGQNQTPRQILGVGKNTTWPEIKSAYRKLVLEFHPDRVVGEVAKIKAEETLKKINAAFAVLAHEFGK